MIEVLCDASVVVGATLEDEPGREVARSLLAANSAGAISLPILDLTSFEVGNALLRRTSWPAAEVAAQLDDLREVHAVIVPGSADLRAAAGIAREHGLTLYDAAYAAVARNRHASLATADGALIEAGLGESPSTICHRLGLDP